MKLTLEQQYMLFVLHMTADALAILGARASAVMVLTPPQNMSCPESEELSQNNIVMIQFLLLD